MSQTPSGQSQPTSQSELQESIIDALRDPSCYSHPAPEVEVIRTHASIVLLVGEHVYKLKRPVDLGFLDYSTLALRKRACEAELELNARLARSVYLRVEPIVRAEHGVQIGGHGEPIEYAVHMRRLPDDARLGNLLAHDDVEPALIDRLADRLATFHRAARSGPEISALADVAQVTANCEENFEQLRDFVGPLEETTAAASAAVFERLANATRAELAMQAERISARARAGVPRDTHGDLRLEHVYLFPDRAPPDDICIIDCIEFNERFRYADPVADVAFLLMDMAAAGARTEAERLQERYFAAAGDADGRELVPLFVAYRATVRGKVRAMQAGDPVLSSEETAKRLQRARGHLLQALVTLAPAAERPCVVLMAGLPGTGKSALAATLAAQAGFEVVRSDVVRKELAGLLPGQSAGNVPEGGIYAPAWTQRTYETCAARAREHVFEGRRVIVDATFRTDAERLRFLDVADAWGVPACILYCEAAPEVVRRRLEARQHDASDADWSVYLHMRDIEEPFGERSRAVVERVDTTGDLDAVATRARAALRRHGLA